MTREDAKHKLAGLWLGVIRPNIRRGYERVTGFLYFFRRKEFVHNIEGKPPTCYGCIRGGDEENVPLKCPQRKYYERGE